MLTIKKRFEKNVIFFLTLALFFAGCTPPGPRALLKGKRLLEQGRYPEAVEQLRTATSILTTNAQAWNYLGLAYHHDGQPSNAVPAYQKALAIDHDLVEVHYNLGCLWLEQNRPDLARTELTAYTLREEKSLDGWLKLGTAQLRVARQRERVDARELAAAEKSFREALKIDSQNSEAWNGLGLVQVQGNRPRDAAQSFAAALRPRPDYRPALLNLAVVLQVQLNDRQGALQKYHEYLKLTPRAADWEAISATVRALEQELAGVTRPVAPNVPAPVVASAGPNAPKPPSNVVTRAVTAPKPEPVTNVAKPPPPAIAPPADMQVVKLSPEPVVRAAQDVASPPPPAPATQTSTIIAAESRAATAEVARAENRGFLTRMNPLNIFRGENGQAAAEPPTAGSTQAVSASNAGQGARIQRYTYRSPATPKAGDHRSAERAFGQGVQAQRAGQFPEAIQAYRRATQADPAYYEAYHNLGLASVQVGNLQQALNAFEMALAIRPESLDARYNFALALKQGNYPLDAAHELEKILATHPKDARAHLALANLYAQQLHQPAKAREHYLKVLEISPDNPQAPNIRDWLWANRR